MITFAKQMRTINTYDYWKDITRENKDAALIRMLEAAVKRDMTAEKPHGSSTIRRPISSRSPTAIVRMRSSPTRIPSTG